MMELRDEQLWKTARRRVAFRKNLYAYVFVNAFLWAIWWFTIGRFGNFDFPWPLWVMFGWGFSLARQYYLAYKNDPDEEAEREYQKLRETRNVHGKL